MRLHPSSNCFAYSLPFWISVSHRRVCVPQRSRGKYKTEFICAIIFNNNLTTRLPDCTGQSSHQRESGLTSEHHVLPSTVWKLQSRWEHKALTNGKKCRASVTPSGRTQTWKQGETKSRIIKRDTWGPVKPTEAWRRSLREDVTHKQEEAGSHFLQ